VKFTYRPIIYSHLATCESNFENVTLQSTIVVRNRPIHQF